MFERNKIDSVEMNGVAVTITTDAGETLGGKLLVAPGRSLADVLNGSGGFVEFEPWGGERILVAKGTIRTIQLVHTPRPESLKSRAASFDTFDPHSILGVPSAATLEEIKAAWHRLSMAYHPDRYAAVDLPPEVSDYLAGMARRINAAYKALEVPMQATRRAQSMRATPVFTSRPRA